MADKKVKNIVALEVIEEPTGEENLLVESNGRMRRLPSSNFSAVGAGGAGGSGFDVTGNITPGFIPTRGDLVLDQWETFSINMADTASLEGEEAMKAALFGDTTNLDTNNIYGRNVQIYTVDAETNEETVVQEMFMYLAYIEETWQVAYTLDSLVESGLGTMDYIYNLSSNYTYAELKAIAAQRPIEVSIAYIMSADGMIVPFYINSSVDFTSYMKMMMLSNDSSFEEMPEAIANILTTHNDFICLYLATPTNKDPVGNILFYEAGTEQNPILGIAAYLDPDEFDL